MTLPLSHGQQWSYNDLRHLWLEWPEATRDRKLRHAICETLGRRSNACAAMYRKLQSWETARCIPVLHDFKQWQQLTSPQFKIVPQTTSTDPVVDLLQEIADTLLDTNEVLHLVRQRLDGEDSDGEATSPR